MRSFTIRSGKFAGVHTIYDNIDEAKTNKITNIKSPWYDTSVQIGDWCLSDDGYIAQCLHRFKLVNKRHRSGQFTDTFRFANGTYWVYYDRNNRKHIKNFYAMTANNHKSSLGNTSKLGKFMTLKKKHFVTLVAGGMDPYSAYIQSYKTAFLKNDVWVQVNKLLNDPIVRAELMEQLQPFMKQIEVKIKEKTGHATINDWLVDQFTTLMVDLKLSAKERRANIVLILNLFGENLGITKGNTSKQHSKEVQEAEFEIMPPPRLGVDSN
jgi:hypothetical protein